MRSRLLEQDHEFRQFATGFLPTLLRAAYLLMGDLDLAEDAAQATMLRVFRHWDRARAAPEAYSRTALVSVCRDYWRRQHRRPQEVAEEEATTDDRTISFSEDVDRREALSQALSSLPSVQREVLVLRYFLDCSVERTAELLGMPPGTVKSSTSRGLQQLRRLLTSTPELSA